MKNQAVVGRRFTLRWHWRAWVLLLSISVVFDRLGAAPIEVSNAAGQKMTVEVLSYTASSGNVRIKRADGQIFNTKIDVFAPASRELIIANAPKELPKFAMDVSIGRKRKDQATSSFMEDMTITTTVKVKNEARDIDLDETTFTIFLVARNAKRYADRSQDWLKVLSVQQFSARLVAGAESKHELKAVETEYDSDKDSSNLGGWEFEGYLLVARDKAGTIIGAKSSLGEVGTDLVADEKSLREAMTLTEGVQTNHDLSRR